MKRFIKTTGILTGLFSSLLLTNVFATSVLLIPEVKHDLSLSLEEMSRNALPHIIQNPHIIPLHRTPLKLEYPETETYDPVLQSSLGLPISTTSLLNILGLGIGLSGFSSNVTPPDTNASVGLTQVVQWVNNSFAIFNKSTGLVIQGPIDGNVLWTGFGGPCETSNSGDPIIKYDQMANRWVGGSN